MSLSLLPRDEPAERSLLEMTVSSPALVPRFVAEVPPAVFSSPERERIAAAVSGLHAERLAVDLVSVARWLQDARQPDAVAELAHCSGYFPLPAHFDHYAGRVRQMARARALWHAGAAMQRSVETLGQADDPEDILTAAATQIAALQVSQSGDTWNLVPRLWMEQIGLIEATMRGEAGPPVERMPFGIPALDSIVDGGERGRLLVIGAQRHVGKTALARAIACEMGRVHRAGWFGMESTAAEEGLNTMAYQARVPQDALRKGLLTARHMDDVHRAVRVPLHLHLDDTPGLTVAAIAARARTLREKNGLDVLLVDYLQLLGQAGTSRTATREQMVAEDARRLKVLARELEALVIVLAQVNDEIEVTQGPEMRHFRESKAIANHADYVLTMSAPEGIAPDDTGAPVPRDLWIRKWRGKGARSAPVKLLLHGETQRFETRRDDPPPKEEERANVLPKAKRKSAS